MSERDQLISQITELLRDSLFLEPTSADADLVEGGVIDSIGFMQLFIILESNCGITIEQADLDLDHFRTIGRMADFVLSKRSQNLSACFMESQEGGR